MNAVESMPTEISDHLTRDGGPPTNCAPLQSLEELGNALDFRIVERIRRAIDVAT